MSEETKSLWGPREQGGMYDPAVGPFDQGDMNLDFSYRFGDVDADKRTEVDFLGTEINALRKANGSTVIVGVAPGLLKDIDGDGDIDEMSKVLDKQAGGVVYTGSLRTMKTDASDMPNLAFHDGDVDESGKLAVVNDFAGQEGAVNHFGVHSPDLNEEYLDELGRTKEILEARGQILIASLLATPYQGSETTMEDYLGDWEMLVYNMAKAGINYVDLNFANPHVPSAYANACEGAQFKMPEMAGKIVAHCREVANRVNPNMKIGVNLRHVHTSEDHDVLDEEVMRALVDNVAPHVDFITASNTDPTQLVDGDLGSNFAEIHPTAGVSGKPLHAKALDMVRFLTSYRRDSGYEYKVLATGGAVDPETIQNFVEAEADAVLSMTGLYSNGELFKDYSESPKFEEVA
ncbi:hypothetical protein HON58_03545 [Candidatus Peregrinibacteria bacterium]|jgi:dihydroorotate dehydrogenase|nr:hypothetical protein [Candidatus Peregrinibacteria bacterium]